jgi:hypothetical protein
MAQLESKKSHQDIKFYQDDLNFFHYQEIDETKVRYLEIKKEEDGNFCSLIEYKGSLGLSLKTPRMRICQNIIYDKNDEVYIIYCTFPKKNPEFYQFFYNLDRHNIDTIIKKYSVWFDHKTKVNINDIENIYRSPILPPKAFDEEPILKLYVPVVNNQISCDIYDQYHKQTMKTLTIGKEIIFALNFEKLLFKKTSCQPVWNILQIKVFNKLNDVNYLFDQDDDEESQDIDTKIDFTENEPIKSKLEDDKKSQTK